MKTKKTKVSLSFNRRMLVFLLFITIILPSFTIAVTAYFSMRTHDNAPMELDVNMLFGKLDEPDDPNAVLGSEGNPYLIYEPHHLNNLYTLQNTKNASLINEDTVFQVSTKEGKPCHVGGKVEDGAIKLMQIQSIGSEDFPFVSTLRGVTAEFPSDYITLPTGEISDTSALGNLQVLAYEGQIDIGLFGNVGRPAEQEGELTASISNLLLSNIQIKTSATGDTSKIEHTDYFVTTEEHETNHIGILAGHAQYCAIYDISVYYSQSSDEEVTKAAVLAFDITEGVTQTKYTTAGGIIGFYHELSINPHDITYTVNSDGKPDSLGGSYEGLGLGIVYSEDIWKFMERHHFDGITVPNETSLDTEYDIKSKFGEELYGEGNTGKTYFQVGVFTFAHSNETVAKDRIAKLWVTDGDNKWSVSTDNSYINSQTSLGIDAKTYECVQLTNDDFSRNSATLTSANYFYSTINEYDFNNYRFMIVAQDGDDQYALLRVGTTANAQRVDIVDNKVILPSALLDYYTFTTMTSRQIIGNTATFSNQADFVVNTSLSYPATYTLIYDIDADQNYNSSYVSAGSQVVPISGKIYFDDLVVPFSYNVTMATGSTSSNLTVSTGDQTISIAGIDVRVNFTLTYSRSRTGPSSGYTYTYSNLSAAPTAGSTFRVAGNNVAFPTEGIAGATYPSGANAAELGGSTFTVDIPPMQFNQTYNRTSANSYEVPVYINVNGTKYSAGTLTMTAPSTNTSTNYTQNTTLTVVVNGVTIAIPVTFTYTGQRSNSNYDFRNLRIVIRDTVNATIGEETGVLPAETHSVYRLTYDYTTARGYARTASSSTINQFIMYGNDNIYSPFSVPTGSDWYTTQTFSVTGQPSSYTFTDISGIRINYNGTTYTMTSAALQLTGASSNTTQTGIISTGDVSFEVDGKVLTVPVALTYTRQRSGSGSNYTHTFNLTDLTILSNVLPLRVYDTVSFMATSNASYGESLKIYMEGSGADTTFTLRRSSGLNNYLNFNASEGFYTASYSGNYGPSNAYYANDTKFKIYAVKIDYIEDNDIVKQIYTPTSEASVKEYDMDKMVLFYKGSVSASSPSDKYKYDILSLESLSWADNRGKPLTYADSTLKMGDPTSYYYMNNTYFGVLQNIPSPLGSSNPTIMVPYGAIGFTVKGNEEEGTIRPKSKVYVIVATDPMQLLDEQIIEISYLSGSTGSSNAYTVVDSFVLPPLPGATTGTTFPIYIYDQEDDTSYTAYPNMNTLLVAYEFEVDIMQNDRTYFLSSSKGSANFVYLSAERTASADTNPTHQNDLEFDVLSGIDFVALRGDTVASVGSANYVQSLVSPYFGIKGNPLNPDGEDPLSDVLVVLAAKDFEYNLFRIYADEVHKVYIDITVTGAPWNSESITRENMIEIMQQMSFNFTSGSYLSDESAQIVYSDIVEIRINGMTVDWEIIYSG